MGEQVMMVMGGLADGWLGDGMQNYYSENNPWWKKSSNNFSI